jgi:hypothetical protein
VAEGLLRVGQADQAAGRRPERRRQLLKQALDRGLFRGGAAQEPVDEVERGAAGV